jgi:hypothetical protein
LQGIHFQNLLQMKADLDLLLDGQGH